MTDFVLRTYEVIFDVCGYICHQMPERGFFIGAVQFPLCYRCAGIVLGCLAWLALRQSKAFSQWPFLLIIMAPMLLDVAAASVGFWGGSNSLRLVTGSAFGLGLPALTLKLLRQESNR